MENLKEKPPKLRIFQLIQKYLVTTGISPKLVLQPYPINGKIFKGLSTLILYIICSMMYLFYEAKTFTENTRTIYMCSLAALIFFVLMILIFNAEELFQLINDCENIINTELKYSASKSIFTETVRLEQKLSKITFFVMFKMTPVFGIIPWIIYTYFIYFTTDLGPDAFELPFLMWVPFNWKNPFGFSIVITVQYKIFSYFLKVGACVIALTFGFHSYDIAMSKCIKEILYAISQNSQAKSEHKHMRKQLIEFIEFDTNVKQLSNHSDWTNENDLTTTFLLHRSDNLAVLFIISLQTIYAFGVLLIACEMCQRLNLTFSECGEMIDQFEWYSFPAKVRRMLPLILSYAQQPVEIKCFGSWACGRETFKYVIKTAFSNFMVLRKFYN